MVFCSEHTLSSFWRIEATRTRTTAALTKCHTEQEKEPARTGCGGRANVYKTSRSSSVWHRSSPARQVLATPAARLPLRRLSFSLFSAFSHIEIHRAACHACLGGNSGGAAAVQLGTTHNPHKHVKQGTNRSRKKAAEGVREKNENARGANRGLSQVLSRRINIDAWRPLASEHRPFDSGVYVRRTQKVAPARRCRGPCRNGIATPRRDRAGWRESTPPCSPAWPPRTTWTFHSWCEARRRARALRCSPALGTRSGCAPG